MQRIAVVIIGEHGDGELLWHLCVSAGIGGGHQRRYGLAAGRRAAVLHQRADLQAQLVNGFAFVFPGHGHDCGKAGTELSRHGWAASGGLPVPQSVRGRAVVLFVKLDADELAAQLLRRHEGRA